MVDDGTLVIGVSRTLCGGVWSPKLIHFRHQAGPLLRNVARSTLSQPWKKGTTVPPHKSIAGGLRYFLPGISSSPMSNFLGLRPSSRTVIEVWIEYGLVFHSISRYGSFPFSQCFWVLKDSPHGRFHKICANLGEIWAKNMDPPDFFTFFPGLSNGSAGAIPRYPCPLFFLVKWGASWSNEWSFT